MFYDRKIKYLDYFVKGERCGNAGFIKLEMRDTVCSITINVNGLRTTDSLSVRVCLVGAGQEGELCTLELVQGRGRKQLQRQNAQNLGDTGIAYDSLEAVRIPISAEREIVGVIGTAVSVGQVNRKSAQIVMVPAAEVSAAAEPEAEAVSEKAVVSEKTPMSIEIAAPMEQIAPMERTALMEREKLTIPAERDALTDKQSTSIKNDVPTEQSIMPVEREEPAGQTIAPIKKDMPTRQSTAPKKAIENKEKKIPLCDNKWKQLWEIYPHITPFRDEREYLSVGPNDFVILPEKYFRMANNSFLLHGYYNYKHLVLKRLEYRGETRYYIGVPGNFYDREKQVALMFGFESFESLEEPAGTGDYGYYLMRIEL